MRFKFLTGFTAIWAVFFFGWTILAVKAGAQAVEIHHKVRPPGSADIIIVNTFNLADLDKNGEITTVEFMEYIKTFSFQRLDRNGDNSISFEEWNVAESGVQGQELFARWDRNLDGQLSVEEFQDTPRGKERIVHIFRTLDKDEDGVLRLYEFDVKEQ